MGDGVQPDSCSLWSDGLHLCARPAIWRTTSHYGVMISLVLMSSHIDHLGHELR